MLKEVNFKQQDVYRLHLKDSKIHVTQVLIKRNCKSKQCGTGTKIDI